MAPESPDIDGASYREFLIERGLLVPVGHRRTTTWWHPEPPTCRLLGVPEERARIADRSPPS